MRRSEGCLISGCALVKLDCSFKQKHQSFMNFTTFAPFATFFPVGESRLYWYSSHCVYNLKYIAFRCHKMILLETLGQIDSTWFSASPIMVKCPFRVLPLSPSFIIRVVRDVVSLFIYRGALGTADALFCFLFFFSFSFLLYVIKLWQKKTTRPTPISRMRDLQIDLEWLKMIQFTLKRLKMT